MSRKLFYSCQGLSSGRRPYGYATSAFNLPSVRMAGLMPSLHIQAWASALPSDMNRAMREASSSRTATDTDSYAFLYIYGYVLK